MTFKNTSAQVLPSRAILSYLKDLPNICSLAGLCCTLIAIYFIIFGWSVSFGSMFNLQTIAIGIVLLVIIYVIRALCLFIFSY